MSERTPPDRPPGGRTTSDNRVGGADASTRSVRDSDAGKVTFSHGGAVWEWKLRTGAFDLEDTTMLLRRLDNPGLRLDEPPADIGTNPYDSLSVQRARGGRRNEAEADVWSPGPFSGPGKADRGTGGGGMSPRDRRERGYNPYGDDGPPPSRRRR